MARRPRISGCVLGVALAACGRSEPDAAGTTGTGGPAPEPTELDERALVRHRPRPIDVLLIADARDHQVQQRVADTWRDLVRRFESPAGAGVDFRIGMTSSDMGTPSCAVQRSDLGALRFSSCREHPLAFADPATCTSRCGIDSFRARPTPVLGDPTPRRRPWLERLGGQYNLEEPLPPEEVATCAALLGGDRCLLTAPLGAMAEVLRRSEEFADPSFGFVRPEADLWVIFVSASFDCTVASEHRDVAFGGNVSTVLESECLAVGAVCDFRTGEFLCVPQDHDASGFQVFDPAQAVLEPVTRFATLLLTIEQQKRSAAPGDPGRVSVSVLGGLPASDTQPFFSQARDPADESTWGIAPSCEDDFVAVPAPRTLQFAAQLSGAYGSIASLCDPDAGVTGRYDGPRPPAAACVPGCWPLASVTDCEFEVTSAGRTERLPHCQDPAAAEARGCWRMTSGAVTSCDIGEQRVGFEWGATPELGAQVRGRCRVPEGSCAA